MSARLRLITSAPRASTDATEDASPAERLGQLRARSPAAERWLFEAYVDRVERILVSVMGHRGGLEDRVQEVFVRVFARVGVVRDPEALPAFVAGVATFVAREGIRTSRRHRWLRFLSREEIPDPPTTMDTESRDALRAFYRVVGEMSADERVCFTLRYVEGMSLGEVAEACGFSLATAKRRLQSAERLFVQRCRSEPELLPWLEASKRWA
ncbi:MAG: RNA polymerase sigma factor [Myxococcales bacterium]|nr:RNA polymerase sigma factor [Myxococcales bacterium]